MPRVRDASRGGLRRVVRRSKADMELDESGRRGWPQEGMWLYVWRVTRRLLCKRWQSVPWQLPS